MKVIVTIDHYDGSTSKYGEFSDMEDVPWQQLAFQMMHADVCGATITKQKNIIKVMEKLNEPGGSVL